MKRYYFMSDDLDDLRTVEQELQEAGISDLQMHVVSEDEATVDDKGLTQVKSLFKRDLFSSMVVGFGVGIVICAILLGLALAFGLSGEREWMVAGISSLLILSFCTWEGGLFGIQVPNRHFRKFTRALQSGKHLFYVDAQSQQAEVVDSVARRHSPLRLVGKGEGERHWLFNLRSFAHRVVRSV